MDSLRSHSDSKRRVERAEETRDTTLARHIERFRPAPRGAGGQTIRAGLPKEQRHGGDLVEYGFDGAKAAATTLVHTVRHEGTKEDMYDDTQVDRIAHLGIAPGSTCQDLRQRHEEHTSEPTVKRWANCCSIGGYSTQSTYVCTCVCMHMIMCLHM